MKSLFSVRLTRLIYVSDKRKNGNFVGVFWRGILKGIMNILFLFQHVVTTILCLYKYSNRFKRNAMAMAGKRDVKFRFGRPRQTRQLWSLERAAPGARCRAGFFNLASLDG